MQQLLNSKSLTLNQVYWELREILSSMCIMCCTSLCLTAILSYLLVASIWTRITWCAGAALPCTEPGRALCMQQIAGRQFIREEFHSHRERCHSRKDSELTLRVSQRLNDAVLASFLCFLLQPDKKQEEKPLLLTQPKSFTDMSAAASVSVCVCVLHCRKFS